MRRFVLILSLGVCCAFQTEARADLLYNGMSFLNFTSSGGTTGSMVDNPASFMSMQAVGVNTVALNIWDFTPSVTSTSIAPNFNRYSSSDAQVVAAINDLHAAGMNVLLKPMLDVNNGTWRGMINPLAANVNTWFTNYDTFIDHYATLGAQNGVNLFSVGCELNNMEQYTSNWRSLISGVRSIYSAQGDTSEKLTYAANWAGNNLGNGGFTNVGFWKQLDYIGIDAYFPLANVADPSEASLLSSWGNEATAINNWRTSAGLTNENVIFTEAGYEAKSTTAENPAGVGSGSTPQDIQAQANAYQALLQTMAPEPWFDGVFWWEWSPGDPASTDNSFDPDNKPATDAVLESFYNVPEPGSAGLAAVCGLMLLQARRRPIRAV
jgi:GTA TIM-barrel-like domain